MALPPPVALAVALPPPFPLPLAEALADCEPDAEADAGWDCDWDWESDCAKMGEMRDAAARVKRGREVNRMVWAVSSL